MSRQRSIVQLCAVLAAVALAKGCGDGGDPAEPEPPRPTTVAVSPATAELTALGASVQLSARVLDQNGQAMAATNVTWSSSSTAVASVTPTGLVTAAADGTATITATAGRASSTATVTVAQAVAIVAVAPAADTLLTADTLRLSAAAADANGHAVADAGFTWVSSDTLVAIVDDAGLVRGVAEGVAAIIVTAGSARDTAEITVVPARKPGPGLRIFDFPMRAIAISGNWGTNREVVQAWEDGGSTGSLIPLEYIAWLRGLHVNWILISVALHYEDSMDSSISRETGRDRNVPTWRDGSLRQMVREFRSHGFEVYMTLAFEAHEAEASARPLSRHLLGDPAPPHTGGAPPDQGWRGRITPANWPWRPDHPDHDRFVGEFWTTYADNAVHFAQIAEQEGVALYSLGTETDRLFRSRPDPDDSARPESGYMYNDFGDELRDLVGRVRVVYSGRLTYDMHANALIHADYHGSGSGAGHLWEDLDLDIVGISGWFPLTASAPTTVLSVQELQASYEAIFQEYLVPLAGRNPDRALVFTEYGSMDVVEAPADPSLGARHSEERVVVDANRNGLDDGEETQASIFDAFFKASARYPGLVNGAFFWDNWIATNAMWADHWLGRRSFAVRGKLAEAVVRDAYARLAGARR
ncbi:MAG: Ig-like domain-containing protein [Gammaproteobacteria bacterium]|nr:Ig-like domain-containing protein [Gammaproteobacteria bacterium]